MPRIYQTEQFDQHTNKWIVLASHATQVVASASLRVRFAADRAATAATPTARGAFRIRPVAKRAAASVVK